MSNQDLMRHSGVKIAELGSIALTVTYRGFYMSSNTVYDKAANEKLHLQSEQLLRNGINWNNHKTPYRERLLGIKNSCLGFNSSNWNPPRLFQSPPILSMIKQPTKTGITKRHHRLNKELTFPNCASIPLFLI